MGAKNATNQARSRAHKLADRLHLSGIRQAAAATLANAIAGIKPGKGNGSAKGKGKKPGKSSKQANA